MIVGVVVGVVVGVCVGVCVGVWVGVCVGVCEIVGVTVGVLVGVTVGVGDRSGSVQAALFAQSLAPVVNEKNAEFGCVGEHTVVEFPGVTVPEVPEFPLSGQMVYENTRSTPVIFCAI